MAGVTVSATSSDATSARMQDNASGLKNVPARPPRKKTGTNTRTTMKVA